MGRVLAIALTLVIAGAERAPIYAQPSSEQPFFMRDLGAGVWGAITNPSAKTGSVANAGFIIGDAGLPLLAATYGRWGNFNGFAPRNILDAEAELAGTKKVPQPVR